MPVTSSEGPEVPESNLLAKLVGRGDEYLPISEKDLKWLCAGSLASFLQSPISLSSNETLR